MPVDIIYSAIFQSSVLMAELDHQSSSRGGGINMRDVAVSIAAQAESSEVACVTTNRLTAFYVKQNRDTIVAIADDQAPPRVMVAFLKEVQSGLKSRLDTIRINTPESELSKNDCQSVLKLSFDSINGKRDNLRIARGEMDQVKQIMVENIDRLLERGERVNLLVDRTGEMSNSANLFNRQATRLQRKMWFQNVKVMGVGAVLLIGSCAAISRAI